MLNGNDPSADALPAQLPAEPRPRLWPALVIVLLMWLGILVPAWLAPVTPVHFFAWFLSPVAAVVSTASTGPSSRA